MSGKRAWQDWAEEQARTTHRCPGAFPAFGMPSDMVSADEYAQSARGMPTHDARTCKCWGAPQPLGAAPAEEAESEPTRQRLVLIKKRLHTLIDDISIEDLPSTGPQRKLRVHIPSELHALGPLLQRWLTHGI